MKYMLLLCVDEQIWEKVSETERQQMVQESVGIANQINATGRYLAAARLQPATTATTVRIRTGKQMITDGPVTGAVSAVFSFQFFQRRRRTEKC
jgi:hypothetical protein